MNLIELTRKLISIPSYVDTKNNEKPLADFLWNYFRNNLPWFELKKQIIEEKRFNLITKSKDDPRIIFLCHLDTVLPNNQGQLNPQQSNGKIYGLGSCDMKGGIATVIKACEEIGQTQNVAIIFDCDEEYYFKGIKKLTREYNFKPELIICPEPTDLEIVNGCRGIIEIEFEVLGKTAHAGKPELGINAIEQTVNLVARLKKELTKNDLSELGTTTVNLSAINGGKLKDEEITIQGNAVSDIAKVLLDIRPANPQLNANKVLKKATKIAQDLKIQVVNEKINIDLQPYLTIKSSLKKLEKAILKTGLKPQYRKNLGDGGFYESAIVSAIWNCPAINLGPKNKNTAHTKDEYVEIKSLEKTKEIFKNLIKQY